MESGPITSWQTDGGEVETVTDFIFLGYNTANNECSHEIRRSLLLGRKAITNLDGTLKSRDIPSPAKCQYSQIYDFSSSHVQMWELDHKEGWELKKLCFQTVVLEKALESPLACKEIKPVNSKGNQPWIFIGRTNAEAPILWPHDEKLTQWKRPWSWERLRAGREEGDRGWDGWMASWLNGHEFEQTARDGKGQWSLSC